MDRRRFLPTLTIIALIAACGTEELSGPGDGFDEGGETPFDVTVTVTASLAPTSGCRVTWKARANDRLVEVSYRLRIDDSQNAAFTGTFRDSTLVVWDQAIQRSLTVGWIVSAGTWAKEGSAGLSC
jgi:hypothetical protein